MALGMVPPGVVLFGALGALSARAHTAAAAAVGSRRFRVQNPSPKP